MFQNKKMSTVKVEESYGRHSCSTGLAMTNDSDIVGLIHALRNTSQQSGDKERAI